MQPTIKITIPVTLEEIKDVLIAQLSEIGFDAFEEEPAQLLAFCNESIFDGEALDEILKPHNLTYTREDIQPQNWNEAWESSFQPVVVGSFAGIRASFHEPVQGVKHEIIITPKMSFGTGHHATTHMMIQQMQNLDFAGKDVFDFGTGTGILAILAKKMGAVNVTAIDIDEWSIDNARENFVYNRAEDITLFRADTPAAVEGSFHIILANINKNVLLEFIPLLATRLNKKGWLLLSGLLAEDEQEILLKASQNSLFVNTTITRDKWISVLLQS